MERNVTLSILICSVDGRESFLSRLMDCLNVQKKDEVEILVNTDNRIKSIGQKRNELVQQAKGEYIAFIDDDDLVSPNYIDKVLSSINKSKPDVVGIHVKLTWNGRNESDGYNSIKYSYKDERCKNGKMIFYRKPNHVNPIKRNIAIKCPFPNISVKEDYAYSDLIQPLLKTEEYVEEPLYFYLIRTNKTV